MKTIQKILLSRWGLFLLVIGIVLFVFILVVRQVQSQEDTPAYLPPPTPSVIPFPSDNTPTPDYLPPDQIYPTDAPFIISKTIDLSPELNEEQEYYIYVRKENGEIVFYLVGPLPQGDELTKIPASILEKLPLEANDVIILWEPPSPMRRDFPPLEPATVIPTIEPTINSPYP